MACNHSWFGEGCKKWAVILRIKTIYFIRNAKPITLHSGESLLEQYGAYLLVDLKLSILDMHILDMVLAFPLCGKVHSTDPATPECLSDWFSLVKKLDDLHVLSQSCRKSGYG